MNRLTPRRSWATLTLALSVLAASSLLGAQRSPWELLTGAWGGSGLDYVAASGTINALTEQFVTQQLGPTAAHEPTDEVTPGQAGPGTSPFVSVDAPNTARPAPVVVAHPPDNDAFGEAYPVEAIPFQARTEPGAAGREPGEPTTCGITGPTVWYRHTPARSVGFSAQAIAPGQPASLGVFTGTSLQDLDVVGCHTAATGAAGLRFPATRGTTLWFQVAAPIGADNVQFGLDLLGTTTRMMGPGGRELPGVGFAVVSATGRFLVFESEDDTLAPDDDNGTRDVFVHDRVTGEFDLVSRNSNGEIGNGASGGVYNAVSADGRWVAFASRASNLVEGDTNDQHDHFLRDRLTGLTTRVSVSSTGAQGDPPTLQSGDDAERRADCERLDGEPQPVVDCQFLRFIDMSPDGRFIAFWSPLRGLAPDQPGEPDEFGPATRHYLHDRDTGTTTRIDAQVGGPSVVSDDGKVVAFRRWPEGGRLNDQYTDTPPQIWVRNMETGELVHATRSLDGGNPNGNVYPPAISGDGRFVVFASESDNLVEGDTNGIVDVFVFEVATQEITRASLNSAGEQQALQDDPDSDTYHGQPTVSISRDGRYVAFESLASNLAPESPGDNRPGDRACADPGTDAFIRDRLAGTTTMVSVSSEGVPANFCVGYVQISDDASVVKFHSVADNLVEDDANASPSNEFPLLGGGDVFFHEFAKHW